MSFSLDQPQIKCAQILKEPLVPMLMTQDERLTHAGVDDQSPESVFSVRRDDLNL